MAETLKLGPQEEKGRMVSEETNLKNKNELEMEKMGIKENTSMEAVEELVRIGK